MSVHPIVSLISLLLSLLARFRPGNSSTDRAQSPGFHLSPSPLNRAVYCAGFNLLGLHFGITAIIGLIPIAGDIIVAYLNYKLIIQKALEFEFKDPSPPNSTAISSSNQLQGDTGEASDSTGAGSNGANRSGRGLPKEFIARMVFNNVVSAAIGFVPLVGDIGLAIWKGAYYATLLLGSQTSDLHTCHTRATKVQTTPLDLTLTFYLHYLRDSQLAQCPSHRSLSHLSISDFQCRCDGGHCSIDHWIFFDFCPTPTRSNGWRTGRQHEECSRC